MPIGDDPVSNYNFSVEIDGQQIAQFQKAEGISIEISVIEHKENKIGGLPVQKKLPGHVQFSDITLTRGRATENNFWEWIKQVQDGDVDGARKNGSITINDYMRAEVGRFNFEMGWPSKVELAGFDASADEVLIETVVLTHEGLKVG